MYNILSIRIWGYSSFPKNIAISARGVWDENVLTAGVGFARLMMHSRHILLEEALVFLGALSPNLCCFCICFPGVVLQQTFEPNMRQPPALLTPGQVFYLGFALPIALCIQHWKHNLWSTKKLPPTFYRWCWMQCALLNTYEIFLPKAHPIYEI